MFFADQPAAVAPSEADPLDVIEVVANRPDQAQKIDRRAYRVKQNSQSAQFNGIQLLRGLPAVTITPDDQIMLLGAAGVTIMVDERPVQGDPILFLRTLHGSDIERIEIMTNPSAQYSAGTGGIVNFVLRKKREDGLSGSANAEVSSHGGLDGSTTIKKKKGKWTYEVQAEGKAGRTSNWTYHKLRSIQEVEGGPSTLNREDGGGHSSHNFAYLYGKVTHDLDRRTNIGVAAFGGIGATPARTHADFVGLTPDFESFSERARSNFSATWTGVELTLDHEGKKDGETLKGSANFYGNPSTRQSITSEFGDDNRYSSVRRRPGFFARSSIDWVHPIRKDQILSVGSEVNLFHANFGYDFSSNDPGQFGPDTDDGFEVRESKVSAYATFQKAFGKWTIMPGLRFEGWNRTISSPGRPSVKPSRANFSPTIHIEHPLSKTLNMTLSYSKRFDTPGPEDAAPYPIVIGPLAIQQGNPGLKEQVTDAYELNLHYSRKKVEGGVILYDRETDRLWSNVYTVNEAGLNVSTPFNVGHRSDRGAQFDISTPLLKRVKGTASINLFSRRVPIAPSAGGGDDTMFRYTANATVEWHAKQKETTPGDIGQVQLTYESPSREFQFRNDGYYTLNLAYTHSLSPTLSVTANLNGLGSMHYRHRLLAPLVQETYDKRDGPEFRLKLVKTLGKSN
jgi:outer membrane receptor for ferrienterochelin and colicin